MHDYKLLTLLPDLLCHTENNVSKGTSRLDKEKSFYSNLPLTLSFTGNKQDWPKAKNKLFIWLSKQERLFYNTGFQQSFPEANGISFNSRLLKVVLEDADHSCPSFCFSIQSLLRS